MVGANHLVDIILDMAQCGIRFIVSGGVAVVLHGVERMTLDLDVSLDMAPKNITLFLNFMRESGFVPRVPLPPETLLNSKLVKDIVETKNALVFTFIDLSNPFRQIDVFITDLFDYNTLLPHTVEVKIKDQCILVASAKKLIEMKRAVDPPREKDLMDIDALTKLLRGSNGKAQPS